MATVSITRRGLVGAMMIAPVVITSPAIATSASTHFQRVLHECKAATAHLDSTPYAFGDATYDNAYNRFDEAWDAMVAAQPGSWAEFVAKFEAIAIENDDVALTEEQAKILLADCRRLLERGA